MRHLGVIHKPIHRAYMSADDQRDIVLPHQGRRKTEILRRTECDLQRQNELADPLDGIMGIRLKIRQRFFGEIRAVSAGGGNTVMLARKPYSVPDAFLRVPPEPPADHLRRDTGHGAGHRNEVITVIEPGKTDFALQSPVGQYFVFHLAWMAEK